MNLIERIDNYITEAMGGKGSPFKLSRRPGKDKKQGEKQYYIKLENPETGKFTDGYISTRNIAIIHKVAGDKGWIITKYYEK